MLRASAFLLCASLALLPAASSAQKLLPMRTIKINPSSLTWYTFVLQHAKPDDILSLMHWQNGKGATLSNSVAQIYVLQGPDCLKVQATDKGFQWVREIIKAVDIAPFEWVPTVQCWTATVNTQELAGLALDRRSYLERVDRASRGTQDQIISRPVEVVSGPGTDKLLRSLITAKRAVTVTVKYSARRVQEWSVGEMNLDEVVLRSDDTVSMRCAGKEYDLWEDTVNTHIGSNPPDLAMRIIFHKSEVIAIRAADSRTVFLEVNY